MGPVVLSVYEHVSKAFSVCATSSNCAYIIIMLTQLIFFVNL